MAKSTRKRIAERPVNPGDRVHVGLDLKDLPIQVRKDHRRRRKELDKLFKKEESIRKEGEEQIESLVRKGVKNG